MLGQKNWLVIMVTKNSLQLVGLGEVKIETIIIPPQIINNLEVINKDGLYTLVIDWLKQRPHTSANIIWLLSPEVYFEHTFTSGEQDKIDSETLQFLDIVPFEEILSRVYNNLDTGRHIIVINKELMMSLIQAFALQGYSTKAVVPSRLVQGEATLTSEIERTTLKRANELAKESLVTTIVPVTQVSAATLAEKGGTSEEKPKSQLPLLLSVFGVLLAILVFVILLNK